MSVVAQLEQQEPSPLASARLHRKLTVDEAARRAGLTAEQIEWLEEGRVYRFPSADDALVAVVLYATALGVDQDEARGLARLPVQPRPERYPRSRIVGVAAGVVVLVALAVTLVGGFGGGGTTKTNLQAKSLPPPWKLSVDVLNGGGDIYYTRALASKIGGLGYKIKRVARANRFDYPSTAVYFEPGGDAYGNRLAQQLGVQAKPLPGGSNPRRLVVIAGPPRIG
jgi:Helix-turn-helix domain/LytR cell envelope-related transcriptional attenuator